MPLRRGGTRCDCPGDRSGWLRCMPAHRLKEKFYRIARRPTRRNLFRSTRQVHLGLAFMTDGSLAVATGDNGKLYRVQLPAPKRRSSLLINTNQTHVMSLAVTAQGRSNRGHRSRDWYYASHRMARRFGLFDAQLREIHALAPADGSITCWRWEKQRPPRASRQRRRRSQPPESGGSATTNPQSCRRKARPPCNSAGDCSPVATIPRTRAAQSSEYCRMEVLTPFGRISFSHGFCGRAGLQPGSVLIGTADKGLSIQ